MTRKQLNVFLNKCNLNDLDVRKEISKIVVDEVIKTRYKRKIWEADGFPPLDVSGEEYLRPVPVCVFGASGWAVRSCAEWFCD